MHASLKRPVRLALVSALLAGFGAHATAAEPFLSATSSLSDLRFQLIDLNPNDGIAPSLSLLRDGTITTYSLDLALNGFGPEPLTSAVPLIGSGSGSPFPSFTQNLPLGVLTSTPTSLTLNTALRTQDLNTLPKQRSETYADGPSLVTITESSQTIGGGSDHAFLIEDGNSFYDPDTGWISGLSGRLSANTALIITGQASVNLHADRSLLDSQVNALGEDDLLADASGIIRAELYVGLSGNTPDPNSLWTLGSFTNNINLSAELAFANGLTSGIDPVSGAATESADAVIDQAVSKTFSMVAFNNGDTANDVSLSISLKGTAAQLFRSFKTTTVVTNNPDWVPTPTIPEPSTYALMGLGLVGLSLVARRQRPRNT